MNTPETVQPETFQPAPALTPLQQANRGMDASLILLMRLVLWSFAIVSTGTVIFAVVKSPWCIVVAPLLVPFWIAVKAVEDAAKAGRLRRDEQERTGRQ